MLGDSVLDDQELRPDIASRKVGDRIAARLVKQHDVFAVDDPLVAEPHPHPAPQRLSEQQPLRQWLRCEEVPDRPVASGPCCHASPMFRPFRGRNHASLHGDGVRGIEIDSRPVELVGDRPTRVVGGLRHLPQIIGCANRTDISQWTVCPEVLSQQLDNPPGHGQAPAPARGQSQDPFASRPGSRSARLAGVRSERT